MTVILMERVPPGLRGHLTRWMVEVGTGVFVAKLSALVREEVWDECAEKVAGGLLQMIWRAQTAQGFDVRTLNPKGRYAELVDGVWLVRVS